MKKIGILTHPQHLNYGGILQCYALSSCLKQMGHDVVVIRREHDITYPKLIIRKLLNILHVKPYYQSDLLKRGANISPFVSKHINRTRPIYSQRQMRRICSKYGLDTVIVGSDQVWRRSFALGYGYNYFLDFVPDGVTRISYAASFGLSDWQYQPEETEHVHELLSRFNAMSVREEEAVVLCKKHLNINVKQVLDPTLLLNATDYSTICSPRLIKEPYLFVYWLDERKVIEDYIKISKSNFVGPIKIICLRDNNIQPAIEDWLSYIKYADLVLTDSFHGCAFSLIFHKRLQVFQNDSGGNGRIASLFKKFGINGFTIENNDYDTIESRLDGLRNESKLFIEEALL